LQKKGLKTTIVGATSGDTGSAAIEACRDKKLIEIFMLHPAGRVSEVQRRQMTTVQSRNVHNIALNGTFDDCQDMVKTIFADHSFCKQFHISAVNSINWVRILAQVVYYFWSALALGAPDRKVIFSVPTGNFGNVFAGYAAHRMGLPVEKFIVASNANDILTRFFETGKMSIAEVVSTLSPSMDIQISSNFERLLYEICQRNGETVTKLMERFRSQGAVNFGKLRWKAICQKFEGHRVDDNTIRDTINRVYQRSGELLDPHTAVGYVAGKQALAKYDNTVITLATAHPAKFPDAMEMATGDHPALPPHLHDLFERKEIFSNLPNDFDSIRDFISGILDQGIST
jgi:threonine synthase